MKHLTDQELALWRDASTDASRSQIVDHLAACRVCSAKLAELVREAPADTSASASAPRFDAADFVASGHRAIARPPSVRVGWAWASAAAAAILLMGIFIPRVYDIVGTDTDTRANSARRGVAVEALQPSGTVEAPFVFRWRNGREDGTYLVEIFDEERELVFSRKLERTTLDSSELDETLEPGRRYVWMVSIVDSSGAALATSALTRFQIDIQN